MCEGAAQGDGDVNNIDARGGLSLDIFALHVFCRLLRNWLGFLEQRILFFLWYYDEVIKT